MSAPFTTNSGALVNTNDVVSLAIAGADYATARFTVLAAGTATATAQVSIDGGLNWFAAAYAKKVSAVSANPTVQAVATSTLAAADVWEVPLPGNATNFRLLCAVGGTLTTVSMVGGIPYVPEVPITAVLYDTTTAVNTALDTGTLDVSGWWALSYLFTMNGGVPAFSIQEVDDAGASTANIITATAALMGGFGLGTTLGGTAGLAAATAQLQPPKRIRLQSAAIVAQTSRIRVQARR